MGTQGLLRDAIASNETKDSNAPKALQAAIDFQLKLSPLGMQSVQDPFAPDFPLRQRCHARLDATLGRNPLCSASDQHHAQALSSCNHFAPCADKFCGLFDDVAADQEDEDCNSC